jgi:hypothetical protein
MLGAQDLWAGRDLYRATPALARDLGFPRLIWRTAPFSRLLRHTRGGGVLRIYSNPDPHGVTLEVDVPNTIKVVRGSEQFSRKRGSLENYSNRSRLFQTHVQPAFLKVVVCMLFLNRIVVDIKLVTCKTMHRWPLLWMIISYQNKW